MACVIKIDPKVLGGTPVFVGSHVPIVSLFDYLKRAVGASIIFFSSFLHGEAKASRRLAG